MRYSNRRLPLPLPYKLATRIEVVMLVCMFGKQVRIPRFIDYGIWKHNDGLRQRK